MLRIRRQSGELLVEGVVRADLGLRTTGQLRGPGRVDMLQDAKAGFVRHELGEFGLGRTGVEPQAGLALFHQPRIVAEERPVTGVDRELLLLQAKVQRETVRDTVRVGDDEGRTVVGLGFAQCGDRLVVLGAEGDPGHVDVTVLHGDERQILFRGALAPGGKLGDRTHRRGLRGLAAGVGVDLRIEHQHLHVGAGSEHMVEATIADVVGPAVAADDPDGFLDEIISERPQARGGGTRDGLELRFQGQHAVPLGGDAGLGGLIRRQQRGHRRKSDGQDEFLQQLARGAGAVLDREMQPQAEFGVVLKERVGPGRPATFLVGAIGRGRQVAAIDGGATRRVGDEQPVADELGEQLEIGRLTATGAGAGEFDERRHELRALDPGRIEPRAVRIRELHEKVPVGPRGDQQRRLRDHVDGLVPRVGLVLGRADLHAQRAAGAVLGCNLDGVFLTGEIRRAKRHRLKHFRGAGEGGRLVEFGADGGVRTHQDTFVALDADRRIPRRDFQRDIALFKTGCARRPAAVERNRADRHQVALVGEEARGNPLDKLGRMRERRRDRGDGLRGGPGRNRHRVQAGERGVHGGEIHLHDLFALLAVGLGDGLLDLRDGLFLGQHAGEREETGLQHGVGPATHAAGLRDGGGVDDVQLELLRDEYLLPLERELGPGGLRGIGRVEQHRGAGGGIAEHVGAAHKIELAAGHEVRPADQVGRADRPRTEAQVRDGHRARLLRVIDKVALRKIVGFLADDLDRVLVRADGAIRAEADKHAAAHVGRLEIEVAVVGQRGAGDIVEDADGEMIPRRGAAEVVEHGPRHARGKFLRAESVAAADHAR